MMELCGLKQGDANGFSLRRRLMDAHVFSSFSEGSGEVLSCLGCGWYT